MTLEELKKYISKTHDSPGIYKFQDIHGKDIYIGKATSLKKRLSSYCKATDSRILNMLREAKSLTWTETESDIEALILESQLIKQHRPKFNIMLRDDKQYFFVAITNDKFPRILLTHQTTGRIRQRQHDIKEFIGPFTDGAALKSTMKFLRNIFPYCTCTQKHHNFCLNYHIGKCLGYCCLQGEQPQEQHARYLSDIKAIRDILSGRKSSLIKELKKKMESSAKEHDFNTAIEIRDKMERLERVFYNAQVIKNSEILKLQKSGLQSLLKTKNPIIRIEGYDISNIQGTHATGSMVTFVHGVPDKNFYRKFKIKTKTTPDDTAMLREVLERRFNHPEWTFPHLILIDGGKAQVNTTSKILNEMNISIPVIGLSKDNRHTGKQLIIPGRKNPVLLSKLSESDRNLLLAVDAEAHRFAINYYRHLHSRLFR